MHKARTPCMQLFSADATILNKKIAKETPSKSSEILKTAQNVTYRPTVYKTGVNIK